MHLSSLTMRINASLILLLKKPEIGVTWNRKHSLICQMKISESVIRWYLCTFTGVKTQSFNLVDSNVKFYLKY